MSTKKKAATQPTTFSALIAHIGFVEKPVAGAPVKSAKNFWTVARPGKGTELHLSIVRRPKDFAVVVAAAPTGPKHATVQLPCKLVGTEDLLTQYMSERIALARRIINLHRYCRCGGSTKLKVLKQTPYLRFACNADSHKKDCAHHIDLPEDIPRLLAPFLGLAR